ncbi:MAG: DNA replication and repair protein RecF, partial [Clostridia bacterium]
GNIIEKLLEKAKKIQNSITNEQEKIELEYITDFKNKDKLHINEYLNSYSFMEIARKTSIKGIQRDDILININKVDVSKYGSQGQKRTVLLTLKLANFELLKEMKEQTPILLLDDIMSELDSQRISFLLKYIENYQSVITTTDSSFVKNIKNIKIYKVLNGILEN